MVDGNPLSRTMIRKEHVNRLKKYEWSDGEGLVFGTVIKVSCSRSRKGFGTTHRHLVSRLATKWTS